MEQVQFSRVVNFLYTYSIELVRNLSFGTSKEHNVKDRLIVVHVTSSFILVNEGYNG